MHSVESLLPALHMPQTAAAVGKATTGADGRASKRTARRRRRKSGVRGPFHRTGRLAELSFYGIRGTFLSQGWPNCLARAQGTFFSDGRPNGLSVVVFFGTVIVFAAISACELATARPWYQQQLMRLQANAMLGCRLGCRLAIRDCISGGGDSKIGRPQLTPSDAIVTGENRRRPNNRPQIRRPAGYCQGPRTVSRRREAVNLVALNSLL